MLASATKISYRQATKKVKYSILPIKWLSSSSQVYDLMHNLRMSSLHHLRHPKHVIEYVLYIKLSWLKHLLLLINVNRIDVALRRDLFRLCWLLLLLM